MNTDPLSANTLSKQVSPSLSSLPFFPFLDASQLVQHLAVLFYPKPCFQPKLSEHPESTSLIFQSVRHYHTGCGERRFHQWWHLMRFSLSSAVSPSAELLSSEIKTFVNFIAQQ